MYGFSFADIEYELLDMAYIIWDYDLVEYIAKRHKNWRVSLGLQMLIVTNYITECIRYVSRSRYIRKGYLRG